jgi:hypothetical protein
MKSQGRRGAARGGGIDNLLMSMIGTGKLPDNPVFKKINTVCRIRPDIGRPDDNFSSFL